MAEFDNETQRDRYNNILRFLQHISQSSTSGSSQPHASDALMKELIELARDEEREINQQIVLNIVNNTGMSQHGYNG